MKRFITLFITLCVFFITIYQEPSIANAAINTKHYATTTFSNGAYIETYISIPSATITSGMKAFSSNNTITRTKTSYYKNSAGTILWSIAIEATFTYDGTTAKCTYCTYKTACYSSSWKIKYASCSKSKNTATATVTATHYINNTSNDITQNVKITCNKNGIIS
ncbi:MAG: hypothetical protein E7265_09685 [Lachnospiraceae bacterium]|nr:hypothetical protein [Lachnospiraceae bacterium]